MITWLLLLLLAGLAVSQALLWRSQIDLEGRLNARMEATDAATRYALSQGAERAVDAAKQVFKAEHQQALRDKIARIRGRAHG
jgi:uncharacterized protein YqgV (UPF0045/DUF77 family)